MRYWEWPLATVLAVAALYLFTDYGIGWDANVHATYGELVLDYFLRGMSHPEQTEFSDLHFYGYLFDLPSAALHRLLRLEMHAFRGLLSAWWAIATIPAVVALGRRLGRERIAVLAALILLVTPQFFGHAFINQKDIPLACAICWAMVAILRLIEDPETSWSRVLVAAGAIGAVLSVRVGALFIIIYLAAALSIRGLQKGMVAGWSALWRDVRLGKFAVQAMVGTIVIWLTVIAGWPYAHENPVLNPWNAIKIALQFPRVYGVLYQGQLIDSDQLPASYLPAYFILYYQPVLLLLIAVGLGVAVRNLWREWKQPPAVTTALVLFWIGFPLLYVVLRRPPIYDGIRHFLFLLPPLALLGALGANSLGEWLQRKAGGMATAMVLGVMAVVAVWPLVRWHPYQYAYENFLAGDPAVRHRNFEGDYWKTSYKAAAEWLNEQQQLSPRPLVVVVAASEYSFMCLAYYLDPRIKWQMTMDDLRGRKLSFRSDYYVGTTRYGMDENFGQSPVVWEERREGVLLCVIRSERHTGETK